MCEKVEEEVRAQEKVNEQPRFRQGVERPNKAANPDGFAAACVGRYVARKPVMQG